MTAVAESNSSSSRALDPPSRRPYLEAALVIGPFLVLALLSAVQIHFSLARSGESPSWWWVIWTNLLAWAPWPIMAPVIIRAWRHRPPASENWVSSGMIHLAGSLLASFTFLVYLTFFRFAFFSSYTGPLSFESLTRIFSGEVGQFFVPVWVTYWVIGAAGLAYQARRFGQDVDRGSGQPATRPEEGVEPDSLLGGPGQDTGLCRIEIRSVGRTRWIELDQVAWIEADGTYAVLHTDDQSHAYRETMNSLEKRLALSGFHRIHRSAIVNVGRVAEIRPASHGDAEVRLDNGQALRVSRTYRRRLDRVLERLSLR